MNLNRGPLTTINQIFNMWLTFRRFLPKSKCLTLDANGEDAKNAISKIYVINLNRETMRWSKMEHELSRIINASDTEILSQTERYAAVDGRTLTHDPDKDADVDPLYTLRDQLYVEPQPLALPTRLELNKKVRMSRAEIAVARSHINVWRKIASGNEAYALVLEDDVWFHSSFASRLEEAWNEISSRYECETKFDILYLSYNEVKHGAPKSFVSSTVFRPVRGLWFLSGYVLSRKGAEKLLSLLPCRGPIDLWINHQFETLDVLAIKRPIISQRRDSGSSNSYSILPSLTTIGAITSEGAAMCNIRPAETPVFAFGTKTSGQTSLAMALSMLGYKCCSDVQSLPLSEQDRLDKGSNDRVFDAYVNIGTLYPKMRELQKLYPFAKFIITTGKSRATNGPETDIIHDLSGPDVIVLDVQEMDKWRVICEHLRCVPPNYSFPEMKDIGQRPISNQELQSKILPVTRIPKRDKSPWIIEPQKGWNGIRIESNIHEQNCNEPTLNFVDNMRYLDTDVWHLRSDTFTDNLALFRPENIAFTSGLGAELIVKREFLGVRNYSAGSLTSRDQYLYGKFEACFQASSVPGVVCGFFLHRNGPRQEIDIEIAGNRPDRLLINVFYNPGGNNAAFEYGYRGTPSYINLGFDASKAMHRYAIEWSPTEILWFVDDRLIHSRAIWDPTPIPHLPMSLHFNSWLSRSRQLAGRIRNRRLPSTTILRSIDIKSNICDYITDSQALCSLSFRKE